MDNDTLNKIKAAMGYRDGTQCCKACKNFVPTDCSGALNAKNAHCTLSPAIEVPVDESGFCKYFAAKVMANKALSEVCKVSPDQSSLP